MAFGLMVAVFIWAVGLSLRQLAFMYLPVAVNSHEPEVALGLGTKLSGTPALIASVVGISLLLTLFCLTHRAGPVSSVGLGLFTGGAAANTTERLAFASVVDYVPVPGTDGILANLGDIALMVGFVLFAVALIRFHVARVVAASWARRFQPR